MKRRLLASILVAGAMAAALPGAVAPASADPPVVAPSPLRWDGEALRDAAGRAVTLRGLNVVYKKHPYLPDASGAAITATSLNDADAALIASWGFNLVRLGLIWKAVQPSAPPAAFDQAYIDRAAQIVTTLASHGIYTLVDFHQDVYNERYDGEGAPDWATQSPLPATNTGNWGGNYFTPAVLNEYDLFWANANGVASEYARAWRAVAERLAGVPGVLGYDLFNEPWPGSQWASCAGPAGCPAFDELVLEPFYQKLLDTIRVADPGRMIYFSPAIPTNFGAGTSVGPLSDPASVPALVPPQTGLSFHVYCLEGTLDGSFSGEGGSCPNLEERAMTTQSDWSRSIGTHAVLSEFGASDDLRDIDRILSLAQGAGVHSWAYWSYKQLDDPTGSPTESLLEPQTLAPKAGKLAVLARPYARLVAGSDADQWWDEVTGTLHVTYLADGGATTIVWPQAIQGSYAPSVTCTPPGGCAASGSGDAVTVTAQAGSRVIVAVSKIAT